MTSDLYIVQDVHVMNKSNKAIEKKLRSDLPEVLVRCRTERNLRLDDVSRATGLTVMTLSLIERRKSPGRRTTLLKIEEFLRKHGYFPKLEAA